MSALNGYRPKGEAGRYMCDNCMTEPSYLKDNCLLICEGQEQYPINASKKLVNCKAK
jgi:hypothetical protein